MKKLVTKKIMLFVSLLGSILSLSFWNLHSIGVCTTIDSYSYETNCELIAVFCAIFLPIFFISAIMFLTVNESVFANWKRFTQIFLPFYLFIVAITPWYTGDEFFHIEKDIIAILLSGMYIVFSVVIISVSHLMRIRLR